MENGEAPIGIFMHLHRRLDEVWTQRALRDLELAIEVRYAVVVADDAFFLDAQHLNPGTATKALPSCSAVIAKRALCAGI